MSVSRTGPLTGSVSRPGCEHAGYLGVLRRSSPSQSTAGGCACRWSSGAAQGSRPDRAGSRPHARHSVPSGLQLGAGRLPHLGPGAVRVGDRVRLDSRRSTALLGAAIATAGSETELCAARPASTKPRTLASPGSPRPRSGKEQPSALGTGGATAPGAAATSGPPLWRLCCHGRHRVGCPCPGRAKAAELGHRRSTPCPVRTSELEPDLASRTRRSLRRVRCNDPQLGERPTPASRTTPPPFGDSLSHTTRFPSVHLCRSRFPTRTGPERVGGRNVTGRSDVHADQPIAKAPDRNLALEHGAGDRGHRHGCRPLGRPGRQELPRCCCSKPSGWRGPCCGSDWPGTRSTPRICSAAPATAWTPCGPPATRSWLARFSDGRFPWNPDRRATLAEVRRIDDVVLLRYALSTRFRMD